MRAKPFPVPGLFGASVAFVLPRPYPGPAFAPGLCALLAPIFSAGFSTPPIISRFPAFPFLHRPSSSFPCAFKPGRSLCPAPLLFWKKEKCPLIREHRCIFFYRIPPASANARLFPCPLSCPRYFPLNKTALFPPWQSSANTAFPLRRSAQARFAFSEKTSAIAPHYTAYLLARSVSPFTRPYFSSSPRFGGLCPAPGVFGQRKNAL